MNERQTIAEAKEIPLSVRQAAARRRYRTQLVFATVFEILLAGLILWLVVAKPRMWFFLKRDWIFTIGFPILWEFQLLTGLIRAKLEWRRLQELPRES